MISVQIFMHGILVDYYRSCAECYNILLFSFPVLFYLTNFTECFWNKSCLMKWHGNVRLSFSQLAYGCAWYVKTISFWRLTCRREEVVKWCMCVLQLSPTNYWSQHSKTLSHQDAGCVIIIIDGFLWQGRLGFNSATIGVFHVTTKIVIDYVDMPSKNIIYLVHKSFTLLLALFFSCSLVFMWCSRIYSEWWGNRYVKTVFIHEQKGALLLAVQCAS